MRGGTEPGVHGVSALRRDVSLHPPCADTACKYTAWQMEWLCSSPPTSLWQVGLMPVRLAGRLCRIHCHKRHIVYRTERHYNTNTRTPRVIGTLGKSLVCGFSVGLRRSLQQEAHCSYLLHILSLLYILLINRATQLLPWLLEELFKGLL